MSIKIPCKSCGKEIWGTGRRSKYYCDYCLGEMCGKKEALREVREIIQNEFPIVNKIKVYEQLSKKDLVLQIDEFRSRIKKLASAGKGENRSELSEPSGDELDKPPETEKFELDMEFVKDFVARAKELGLDKRERVVGELQKLFDGREDV